MHRLASLLMATCIMLIVVVHASMIFLTNMPWNQFKAKLHPLLDAYSGPFISQGWSLFAPRPYPDDIHVLVRGRLASGSVTKWLDVTRYFLFEMRAHRFTATRAIFAGLQHAAPRLFYDAHAEPARSIVTRTSAMVLMLYERQSRLRGMQIELDAFAVHKAGTVAPKDVLNVSRLSWQTVPRVVSL